MFAQLNFKSAGDGKGGTFYLLWAIVTVLNATTVFALIAGGLLAWRWFGWN